MPTKIGQLEPITPPNEDVLPAKEGRTRPAFQLVLKHQRFEWDHEAKEYFPRLMRLPVSPGINGVDNDHGLAGAIANHHRLGRFVINNGDPRLRIPDSKYEALRRGYFRARWVARSNRPRVGIYAYGWAWESYSVVLDDIVWEHDAEMKREFQRHLVRSELVEPMAMRTREALLKHAEASLRNFETSTNTDTPAKQRLYRQKIAVLNDLYDDFEAHGGFVAIRITDPPEVEPKQRPKPQGRRIGGDFEDDDAPPVLDEPMGSEPEIELAPEPPKRAPRKAPATRKPRTPRKTTKEPTP